MLKDKFRRFCSIFEDQSAFLPDYYYETILLFIIDIIGFYFLCPSEYRFNNIWFFLQLILYIIFLILFFYSQSRSGKKISPFKVNELIPKCCSEVFSQSYLMMSFSINGLAYICKLSSLVITPIYIMIPFIITIICGLISFICFCINERISTDFINLMSPFLDDYGNKLDKYIFHLMVAFYLIYAAIFFVITKQLDLYMIFAQVCFVILILKFSFSFYGSVLDLYSTIKNKHFIKNPMVRDENYQDLIRETQRYYVSHFKLFTKKSEIRDNEELNLLSIRDLDLTLKYLGISYSLSVRRRHEIGIEVAVVNTLDEDILMFYDEKDLEIFENSDYLSNKECGTFNGMKYIAIKPEDNLQFQARFEGDICYLDVDDTLELKYLGFNDIEKDYNEILEEEHFD